MKKEIKVYPDKNGRQKGISPEGKKFDSVSEFLKEKIIEILGEFDACYFCEDEGGLAYKIDLFIPKLLELFEAEKQKWAEDLIKKIPKKRNVEICSGGYKTFYKRKDLACMFEFGKNEGYNQALKELKTIIENAK